MLREPPLGAVAGGLSAGVVPLTGRGAARLLPQGVLEPALAAVHEARQSGAPLLALFLAQRVHRRQLPCPGEVGHRRRTYLPELLELLVQGRQQPVKY